jgi:ATP-binding cassette, subfamily B, bacterial MsbA
MQLKRDQQTYKRLLGYLAPYKGRFILSVLVSIPASSLNGLIAWMIGPFLDSMIKGNDLNYLIYLPFGIIIVATLQGLFEYFSDYYTNYVGYAITRDVRMDLFRQLNKMDLRYFKVNSSGELLTRYYSDPTTLQQAIVTNLQGFIVQFFTGVFLAVVLFSRNWQLAIFAIMIISMIGIPLYFISQKIRKLDHLSRDIAAGLANLIYESIFGIKEIISFQRQNHQAKRFTKALEQFFSASMRITKTETILKPIMQLIAGIGIAGIIFISTYQIQTGAMTRGDVASFLVALVLLYKPIKVIATIIGKIQRILAPAERVFQKMDLQPELIEPENPVDAGSFRSLTFEHVAFEYNPDKQVLKDINFTVEAGETVALVGPSGGGKTTMVELIPRFLDPTGGRILFNQTDLRDMSLNVIRSHVALVSQDTILFDGSIADNIRFGKLSATDEEVRQAAHQAFLTDWIDTLPAGFETRVGERGSLVSGGQKQRISLARAFLKDAPILILDEATSALDSESEKMIQQAIHNITRNRTVFIIAHRFSTIQGADRIMVIENGCIVETGSHKELMSSEGTYYRLHSLQFKHPDYSVI